jgi:hypothetical protein
VRTINRVGILSLAKMQALLLSFLGLIAGILYSLGGLIYDVYNTGGVNIGTALAFLALIGMPLIFAIFGFVVGIFEAILYNVFAKWFGGIELNIE